jgi:hypothetical protein
MNNGIMEYWKNGSRQLNKRNDGRMEQWNDGEY